MAMGSMNWNIVSLSGEAMFQQLGLHDNRNHYVEDSLATQGHHFGSPYGLYLVIRRAEKLRSSLRLRAVDIISI